jgi:two-component system alkaline phosphatase synthesis response regulator PhoP
VPRLLVVEDDPAILTGLVDLLERERFEVLTARDGAAGLKRGLKEEVDLIVLDVLLPKLDGFEVCRRLRADNVTIPILMLTAKTQEADKVMGLERGADDYVTKPFGVAELVARVKALLRRSGGPDGTGAFVFSDTEVDFGSRRVKRSGREVALTARQFDLLRYLIRHRGRVITREELLRRVWGYDDPPVTRTVDAHMAALRSHLEPRPARPKHFLGVRSVGYRFQE